MTSKNRNDDGDATAAAAALPKPPPDSGHRITRHSMGLHIPVQAHADPPPPPFGGGADNPPPPPGRAKRIISADPERWQSFPPDTVLAYERGGRHGLHPPGGGITWSTHYSPPRGGVMSNGTFPDGHYKQLRGALPPVLTTCHKRYYCT